MELVGLIIKAIWIVGLPVALIKLILDNRQLRLQLAVKDAIIQDIGLDGYPPQTEDAEGEPVGKDTEPVSENLISFDYTDAQGERTQRTVEMMRVYSAGGRDYIEGFCRLRNDLRTFRADRIDGDIYVPAKTKLLSPDDYVALHWRGDESDTDEDDIDDAYVQYWESSRYVPVNANLKIKYRGYGRRTETFDVHVDVYNGSSLLEAYCDQQQRELHLLITRIEACIDTDTGEVITNLPNYLLRKYHQSPEGCLEQAMNKLADIMIVLYYVGKADGALRQPERDILQAVIRRAATHDKISDQMIDKEINKMTMPSLQTVKLAINRICKANPRNMLAVSKIAQCIVDTQKSVHPSEAEMLAYMQAKIEKENIATAT